VANEKEEEEKTAEGKLNGRTRFVDGALLIGKFRRKVFSWYKIEQQRCSPIAVAKVVGSLS